MSEEVKKALGDELQELAESLYKAKLEENKTKAERVRCEERIAALIETGANQSKTVPTSGGLKITIKRALGYTADVEALQSCASIPEEVMPLKWVEPTSGHYVFDEKAYEHLKKDHPDVYESLTSFVDTAPRKPSVTVKLV